MKSCLGEELAVQMERKGILLGQECLQKLVSIFLFVTDEGKDIGYSDKWGANENVKDGGKKHSKEGGGSGSGRKVANW